METWLIVLLIFSLVLGYVYTHFAPPSTLDGIRGISQFRALWVILQKLPFNQVGEMDAKTILKGDKLIRVPHRGTWAVVVANVETAKQVFSDITTFPKFISTHHNPQSAYAKFMGENIVESNSTTWKRHRSVVKPGFRQQFDPELFVNLALKLTKIISENDGHEVDIHPYIRNLTVDALGTALLGVNLNSLDGQHSEFLSYYENVTLEFVKPLYYILPFFDHPLNPFRSSVFNRITKVDQVLAKYVHERKEELKLGKFDDRRDLLTLMLKESENGIKFSDVEIQDNIRVLFLAGHDTTSSSLSIVLYLLARYPEVQAKAREEAIRVLGSDPTVIPTSDSLKSLDYITAIIKETLRLYPSIAILPERVTAKDTVLQGHVIPKGTIFILYIYILNRDPDVWSDPNKFIPERFLSPDVKIANWLSFGSGPRACIGLNFSLLEQRLVLATILRTYNITLPPSSSPNQDLKLGPSYLLKPDDLRLNFSPL